MNRIDTENLTGQTKYRLNEITKIKDYFNQEINQRKLCSKKLSKYVAAFSYIDNVLIVLSATCGGVRIISSASVAGAPVGLAGASFTLIFSLTTGITKKLKKKFSSMTKTKRKSMIKFLCWFKVNSVALKL